MLISFVITAYNASATIGHTLESIFTEPRSTSWEAEAIVVDDGSTDKKELAAVVDNYPSAHLVVHACNRGMCAARNTGISASKGDIIAILDSDDTLVARWDQTLEKIYSEWPTETPICYTACRNPKGRITVQDPTYRGWITLDDILNERHAGEYMPLFRGAYIREHLYTDLNLRKSCGIVSYIKFALDAPFWVTPDVLRIYDDQRVGSVSADWTNPKKASETVRCYQELFKIYGELYRERAPRSGNKKHLKLSVYLRLAGQEGAWNEWWQGASWKIPQETLGAFLILILGPQAGAWISRTVKKMGWIKRYG